jgi:hypothetical protein
MKHSYPMSIWERGSITGLWKHVRNVSEETADTWLHIFKKDAPNTTFKVSKTKPKG